MASVRFPDYWVVWLVWMAPWPACVTRLAESYCIVYCAPKWPKIARFSRETQPLGGVQHGGPVELELNLRPGIGAASPSESIPGPRFNSNHYPEEPGAGAHRSKIDDAKTIVCNYGPGARTTYGTSGGASEALGVYL